MDRVPQTLLDKALESIYSDTSYNYVFIPVLMPY